VDRLGPAIDLPGEHVGPVRFAASTLAARIPAAPLDCDERGGDEGPQPGQLLELGIPTDLETRHGTPPL